MTLAPGDKDVGRAEGVRPHLVAPEDAGEVVM